MREAQIQPFFRELRGARGYRQAAKLLGGSLLEAGRAAEHELLHTIKQTTRLREGHSVSETMRGEGRASVLLAGLA